MKSKSWKLDRFRFRTYLVCHGLPPLPSFLCNLQSTEKKLAEEIRWDEAKDGMEWNPGEA
jgi:hypothetical protein